MKILIATDSFKGSKTSLEAAHLMREGAHRVFPDAQFTCIPIADGGEGTVEAIINFRGGKIHSTMAHDPLGQPVQASYGLSDSTAILEISAASGLPLVPPEKRDVSRAGSYGSGELLNTILNEGYRHIIMGIGGSATNDGGAGIAQALGYSLKDESGRELPPGGAALLHLHSIDDSKVNPALREAKLEVVCDVDNPLLGPEGASAIYGPQKGASPAEVEELDTALAHYAHKIQEWYSKSTKDIPERTTQKPGHPAGRPYPNSPSFKAPSGYNTVTVGHPPNPPDPNFPGAGAAGGIGFGLMALCGAKLKSGIETMLSLSNFDNLCQNAQLVITGEGRIDGQSTRGKVPVGVANHAHRHGVPVLAIVGSIGSQTQSLYKLGIESIICLPDGPMSLKESIARADKSIPDASERACRTIRIGMNIQQKKEK